MLQLDTDKGRTHGIIGTGCNESVVSVQEAPKNKDIEEVDMKQTIVESANPITNRSSEICGNDDSAKDAGLKSGVILESANAGEQKASETDVMSGVAIESTAVDSPMTMETVIVETVEHAV